ncbi:MAG: SDR family NAD(P)-dependent oxidoreductase [Chloroflexi bacterium]|nr:SDR family NAD(P)-dependent oxidoreductase [Chloroflexota bacterium]
MNKKIIIGGIATILAGIGIYKFISTQNSKNKPGEIWTTANIPDLTGKVIIVTGANSGVGFEAAKEFARKGAQIILACRSMEKAEAALTEIQAEIPNTQAEIMQLDLASQASVHQFANEFKAKNDQLDVLVNNAGIMMTPYGTTEDGFEQQFGTNHLGHFALTGLLIDLLLKTPGSRVVNVSSNGHRFGNMNFANLMFEGGNDYSPARAYGRSKLANLLFTYELQHRYEAIGADASATAAHPGGSSTNLSRHIEEQWYFKMFSLLWERIAQSAAMGALPTIRAAVDPNAKGGYYYGPNGFMEQGGYPIPVQSNDASHNRDDAKRLWDVSEELTAVHYQPLAATQP